MVSVALDERNEPERSVHVAGKLGTVRHETTPISKAFVEQRLFDGTDSTVHHVARRHNVSTCSSISERDVAHAGDAFCVVNGTVWPLFSAVAVSSVLAQADVCCDDELGELFPYQLDGLNDGRVGMIGERPSVVLLHDDGHAKQDD